MRLDSILPLHQTGDHGRSSGDLTVRAKLKRASRNGAGPRATVGLGLATSAPGTAIPIGWCGRKERCSAPETGQQVAAAAVGLALPYLTLMARFGIGTNARALQ